VRLGFGDLDLLHMDLPKMTNLVMSFYECPGCMANLAVFFRHPTQQIHQRHLGSNAISIADETALPTPALPRKREAKSEIRRAWIVAAGAGRLCIAGRGQQGGGAQWHGLS
jgi:hypothetical protein